MQPLITFISDFGLRDAYVAQVKARILTGAPAATIVDITHELPAYSILSGAWLTFTSYAWFPVGTIHLAVVDPGVGTTRDLLAVEKDGHVFVGPDNGIFSFLYTADKVIAVQWRPEGSIAPTFHGRDIFAPVVIKVLQGSPLEKLGVIKKDPLMLDVHKPMVVHIDRFGNIITNIPCPDLQDYRVEIAGQVIKSFARTFTELPPGDLGLICRSASTVEIVAQEQNAAEMIGAWIGMPLSLRKP